MENNPMKILYKHFGEEKPEDQEMYSIANVFHKMGNAEDEEENKLENNNGRTNQGNI